MTYHQLGVGDNPDGASLSEERTAFEALRQRTDELERFHRLSVGRELRMIELKRQINDLATQLGQALPFDLEFLRRAGEA